MSNTESALTRAKVEAQRAMARVILTVTHGEEVDPEDIVVIRGSSEQFAELAEAYIEVRAEAKSFDEAYGV